MHSRRAARLPPLLAIAALVAGCTDLDRAVAPRPTRPLFNHTRIPIGPSRIVFQSNRDGDNEIYSMNVDGSDVTQLTMNSTDDYLPIWSPDGRQIVWGACSDGCDVAVMNADGSDQHVVFHNGFPGAWSPDGNRIAFSGGGDYGEAVWVINVDGSGLTRVADPQYITGWSPDGKQLQLANDYDGDFEIYLVSLDSGATTKITDNSFSDYGNGWSPDGSRLAIISDRDGDSELFVMNADGSGEPTQLTHDGAPKGEPTWSFDGTQLTFDSNIDGNHEIYVINADGSPVAQLTFSDPPTENTGPGWGQPLSLSNDDFAGASAIPALPFSDDINLTLASTEPDEPIPSCALPYGGVSRTAWYSFTPTETRFISASTVNAPIYTAVAAYTGSALGGLSEMGCGLFGQRATFRAEAGTTYYFLVGALFGQSAQVEFRLDVTPPPTANFFAYPLDPTVFDDVQFYDNSVDSGGGGIQTRQWDFGDGTVVTTPNYFVTHRYARDGSYTVGLTVTTPEGRTGSTSQTVLVRTHDVAITKFSTPTAASAGQTRNITVGLNSKRYLETVQVQLLKSVPGGFELVGSLIQAVPVRPSNRTTDFSFSYTFSAADAQLGKVTFRAVAYIGGARDALPADNEAIAPQTKVNR